MNTRFIPTHGLDCGANASTLYTVATGGVTVLSHAEVLNLPEKLPAGSKLVCEYSHLGCERTEFSLSQPYDRHQLLDLYKRFRENDIELRLFPQKSTPRAAAWSTRWKNDMNDPVSIANLVRDFPQTSLMHPPEYFDLDLKRKASYEIKKYLNRDINKARRERPIPYWSDYCCKLMRDNLTFLNDNLDDTARSVFGFTTINTKGQRVPSVYSQKPTKEIYKAIGLKKGDWHMDNVKFQALYPLFAAMIDPVAQDWRVRECRPDLFIPLGINYIKRYVFCQSPFHLKGGVARSNLYYHGLKNWAIAEGKLVGINLKGKCRGGFLDEKARKTKDENKNLLYPVGKIQEGTRFTPEEDAFFVSKRQEFCRAIKDVLHLVKQIGERELGKYEVQNVTLTK